MNSIPSEVLTKALEQIREQQLTKPPLESSETTNSPTTNIVDITDQYVGKSLTITGAPPPKKPLTPAERDNVTETSPEK